MKTSTTALAPLLLLSASACTPAGGAVPSRCEAIEVDSTRELLVTDATVTGDARVAFARVMGAVLSQGGSASAREWVEGWSVADASITHDVTESWGAASFDLDQAPFELIAISNRLDLVSLERPAEFRFVYGLVTSGTRRPLTVAVELQLPPTETTAEWASRFHALGSLTGDANRQALLAIAEDVLGQPLRGQVRTQDALGAMPLLLEFDIHDGAPLAASPLFNQPGSSMDPRALAAFVSANSTAVMADEEVLPATMLAPSALATPPNFALPGVSADLNQGFTVTTCNGCHTAEPTLDGAFHISPLRRGDDAVSTFLRSTDGQPDELARRADVLRGLLCESN
jgi:hypothetical protein